ncbi:MAG: TerC family protein [Pseudomonadota bacterium]
MSPWVWAAFTLFIVLMLALDLVVFQRRSHEIKIKEAIGWSIFWIVLSLVFNAVIYMWQGYHPAVMFFTSYIVEKSLSVDNLFVFLMIFTYFDVPKKYQHKVLFWGVLGAIVMRAIFIFGGIALIERFHFTIYLLGAFLVFTGIKMAVERETKVDPEKNIVLKMFRKFFPITRKYREGNFWVRERGKIMYTPLFVVLLVVESSDIIFAVDSVPAVLAITTDPFIVFTSNIFAILGLRALFFALSHFADKFCYLKIGISVVLSYVGVKMLISDIYKIPVGISLSIITGVFLISILASLLKKQK